MLENGNHRFFLILPWITLRALLGKQGCHEGQDKKQHMKTGKFMCHPMFSGT